MLVSPDMMFNENSKWKYEIQQSWEAYIEKKCTLTMPVESDDHRSGVKVFGEPDYTVADLRRIARAVVYFEKPLNEYFFTFRSKRSRHDRINNRADNPTFKGKDLDQILLMIESVDRPIGNPITYWNRIFPVPPASEGYWWSYTKTSQHGGCIEMTKPAAWYGWEHAVKWVESTMCFVQAALLCPSSRQLRQYEVSEKGLDQFVMLANRRDLDTIHRETMDLCNRRTASRDGPAKKTRGLAAAGRGRAGTDLANEVATHLGVGAAMESRV